MTTPGPSLRVDVAIFADLTDQTMPILDFAAAVEERGFRGLFLNEHTHQPVEHPTSTFPAGGEIPERYARFWDPLIALSFVAAQTSLQVGTAVSLIGEHDPIQLAHALATLDALSAGRLVLGVGWGWHREEFANHGRPPERRAQVVEEWVAVLRSLWADGVASHEGEFVHLSPSRSWPKPVQQPGPPILLGAVANDRNFKRIARWADGWITSGESVDRATLAAHLAKLRHVWIDAGRDASGPSVSFVHNPSRTTATLRDVVATATELGIDRVLHHIYEGDREAMLRRLDRAAAR